jgi:nifR3 family TIM-barrel protein
VLHLGPLVIETPFIQAALSGYSDGPMRRLARRYGCPYAINEVILDRLVVLGGRAMRRSLALATDDHPVGGQLMGAEPRQFAQAADLLVGAGYDVVDINFGCPVRKVVGRCRGGFLLSTPETAVEILRSVYNAVGGRTPVTLKMRRGMDDSAESEHSFFRILDAAFEMGLDAVTVHGRTVRQRYVGPSDWSFLARVKRHAGRRTILGSGDAFTAADCVRMLDSTGVDGVSIARGAIGNPWIFREAAALHAGRSLPAPPSIAEQRAALQEHFALLCEAYGPDRVPAQFRKFGVRYSELHPHSAEVKMAFLAVRSEFEWRVVLDRWYDPVAEWPAVVRRDRPEALVAAGASWACGNA